MIEPGERAGRPSSAKPPSLRVRAGGFDVGPLPWNGASKKKDFRRNDIEAEFRILNQPALSAADETALDFEREFAAVDAHDGSEVFGHILLSRTMIDLPAGAVPAVLLAPLCVKNGRRRSGIGTALLEWSAAAAKAAGERWMVVLGDPACCGRFGFRPLSEYGLRVSGDAKDELLSYGLLLPLSSREVGCERAFGRAGRLSPRRAQR